jgi:tetratricopeptide (TPR) repeat protein
MKKEKSLDDYYYAIDNENFSYALEVLNRMVVFENEIAWYNAKKAECFYELRDYKKAVTFCRKSLKIQPNYPLALWTISNAFYYLQKYKQCIQYLYFLDEMDENMIGKQETSMGITWARSLKMDVCLKLADALYMIHNDSRAITYYNKFREYRKKRVKSSLPIWYIKDLKVKFEEIILL